MLVFLRSKFDSSFYLVKDYEYTNLKNLRVYLLFIVKKLAFLKVVQGLIMVEIIKCGLFRSPSLDTLILTTDI